MTNHGLNLYSTFKAKPKIRADFGSWSRPKNYYAPQHSSWELRISITFLIHFKSAGGLEKNGSILCVQNNEEFDILSRAEYWKAIKIVQDFKNI